MSSSPECGWVVEEDVSVPPKKEDYCHLPCFLHSGYISFTRALGGTGKGHLKKLSLRG